MTDAEIVIEKVSKVYKAESRAPVFALTETTLAVAQGKFVCILGPSGCGKSKLLAMVAGLGRPTSGTLRGAGAHGTRPGPDSGGACQSLRPFTPATGYAANA